MNKENDTDYVKATSSGKLYVDTLDFFKQEKIKKTIQTLLDSDIIKEVERHKFEKSKA